MAGYCVGSVQQMVKTVDMLERGICCLEVVEVEFGLDKDQGGGN